MKMRRSSPMQQGVPWLDLLLHLGLQERILLTQETTPACEDRGRSRGRNSNRRGDWQRVCGSCHEENCS